MPGHARKGPNKPAQALKKNTKTNNKKIRFRHFELKTIQNNVFLQKTIKNVTFEFILNQMWQFLFFLGKKVFFNQK